MIHLLPLPFFPLTFLPFAAADDEWMSVDKQGECLRRQPSFRPADVHLFGIGNPRSGQGIGGCFFGKSGTQ